MYKSVKKSNIIYYYFKNHCLKKKNYKKQNRNFTLFCSKLLKNQTSFISNKKTLFKNQNSELSWGNRKREHGAYSIIQSKCCRKFNIKIRN